MSAPQLAPSEPAPVIRRPRPDDAVGLALETFVREERVDMQSLAAQLGVSPATLYRWFGSRGTLLEAVLERLTEQFSEEAQAGAQGTGDERVLDWARRLMIRAAAFEPLRSFVTREPQLALRLLLGRGGAIHSMLSARTAELVAQARPAGAEAPREQHVHLIVQIATALAWATFTIGDEPEIDSAVEVIGLILAAPAGDRQTAQPRAPR